MADADSLSIEETTCPMGCAAGDSEVLRARDELHQLPGLFRLVSCRRCRLMRLDPRPTAEALAQYYPGDYAPHQASEGLPVASSPNWRARVRKMLDSRSSDVPSMKPGVLLEVGCGNGSFLAQMKAKGWEVEGIEASPHAVEMARQRQLDVRLESAESIELTRSYDLIVAFMAIEHLHDPLSVLRRLRDAVSPDGRLVVSVPDAGSWEFRLFRSHWYALQLPTHLYHFTPKSLRALLERAGWLVEREFHQRTMANVFASLGIALRARGWFPRLSRWLLSWPDLPGRRDQFFFPLAWLLASIGQTGRMTIWARPGEVNR